MFRLESISPLIVAWAVSLGLGGLLLMLFFSDDPTPEDSPVQAPVLTDQASEAPVDRAAREPERPEQDVSAAENPVGDVGRPVAAPEKVVADNRPPQVAESPPRPDPPGPVDPPVAAKPKQPAKPKPPRPTPAPRPAEKIEAALKLPVVRYLHQKPIMASVVIREIEQLGGIEVRIDESLAGDNRLDRTVQLDLSKTTAGGILDALLEMIGLTRRVHDGYVLIVSPANGADSRGTR